MNKLLLTIAFIASTTCLSIAQQTMGLFLNDPVSVNGYTLFSNSNTVYLIDNCGFVINTWESDFGSSTAHYLLENGNLLRTCRIGGSFSGGGIAGRLELFNWEGDMIWSYDYATASVHQHHDVEPLPNGNILILAWEARTTAEAIQAGRLPDFISNQGVWPDQIIEIEMVGNDDINIVWEWHAWDHLIQEFDSLKANYGVVADHPELIHLNYDSGNGFPMIGADWIHGNAIDYHPELDQIALSSRHFSEIWVIDHSTTTEEAAGHEGGIYGKGGDLLYRWGNPRTYNRGTEDDQTLFGQHNITWIQEPDHFYFGKFLVFNNGIGRPGGNFSSVDIWTPPTDMDENYLIEDSLAFGPDQLDWTYDAPGFFAANISGVHDLPNGNLMVCEGPEGRFFELSGDGDVVWTYINPVSSSLGPLTQGQSVTQNSAFRAVRYPDDYPAFEGKDLTPTTPIELMPITSSCVIYDSLFVDLPSVEPIEGVWLNANPIRNQLSLNNDAAQLLHIKVIDMMGRPVASSQSSESLIEMDAYHWSAGIYLVQVTNAQKTAISHFKLLKQ